jgi:hypothetical protein
VVSYNTTSKVSSYGNAFSWFGDTPVEATTLPRALIVAFARWITPFARDERLAARERTCEVRVRNTREEAEASAMASRRNVRVCDTILDVARGWPIAKVRRQ